MKSTKFTHELYVIDVDFDDKSTYLWRDVESSCYENYSVSNGTICVIIQKHKTMEYCVRILTTDNRIGWCSARDLKLLV
jgi:hypothetical protein